MPLFKASAHSLKHFTSRSFLKISLSLYTPITSDECHAWFHLNAASPAERDTEQVIITKNLVHDDTAFRLQVDRLHHSATPTLQVKELNWIL